MSDLVGNPEDRFSHNEARFVFTQMKHCCVEDPSDLCSVNISGKEITDVKEEDLALFDNVAYVNASENYLPFGKHTQFESIFN